MIDSNEGFKNSINKPRACFNRILYFKIELLNYFGLKLNVIY